MLNLLLILSFIFYSESFFPDSSYTQYSWKEFYQLPEVNQSIDFGNPDLSLLSACIFYVSNEQRVIKGKKEFTFSVTLRNAAQFHTEEMITKKFFSHNNPKNTAYATMTKRIKKFNCRFDMYGENIAYFSTDDITYLEAAKELVNDWMNSKGHRYNLMNSQFIHLGCGVGIKPWAEERGAYLIYATQDFGGLGY